MRLRAALIAILIVLSLVWATTRAAEFGPYHARFVKAYDGDTITVQVMIWPDLMKLAQIRLAGVDTPEIRGDCDAEKLAAREARDFVRATLADANIRVTIEGVGKYGRAIGRITVEGDDLGRMLLEADHARPYDGGRRQTWC